MTLSNWLCILLSRQFSDNTADPSVAFSHSLDWSLNPFLASWIFLTLWLKHAPKCGLHLTLLKHFASSLGNDSISFQLIFTFFACYIFFFLQFVQLCMYSWCDEISQFYTFSVICWLPVLSYFKLASCEVTRGIHIAMANYYLLSHWLVNKYIFTKYH